MKQATSVTINMRQTTLAGAIGAGKVLELENATESFLQSSFLLLFGAR
jgi:hypothetical protein